MKNNKKRKNPDLSLVYCMFPKQYEIFDRRINKPICFQDIKDSEISGSMVLQEMDEIVFNKKRNIKIEYFTPNNVALLLSVSEKALNDAKDIYETHINPYKVNQTIKDTSIDKKSYLIEKSKIICDYLEKIQISIVFSYTALETFCNISIPENYIYRYKDNKGIIHSYNKDAIERWLSLREKISKLLTNIYKTKKIETTKFWNCFIKLEEYRNNIIHQKSIDRTEFLKLYFRPNISKICKSSIDVLQFFYKKQAEKDFTNPLWPWLINPRKEFPIRTDFKSDYFEVVGNLYEGIKKRK